jgi:hypothetical protein
VTKLITLEDRRLFTVGETVYCWSDVVEFARLRGDWDRVEQETREGFACMARLRDLDEELGADELRAAARNFRYARNLVAADELSGWLERFTLTSGQWLDYLRRSLLRGRWGGELPEILAAYPVSGEEAAASVWAEGACSGTLELLAHELAARAATHAYEVEAGEGADEPLDGAERLKRFEVEFERFRRRAAAAEPVEREIEANRIEWLRVDCELVELPDEEVAREAALCVRADGRPLAEVAAQAGMVVQRIEGRLDELDAALAPHLLSARSGDLLGPLALADCHALVLVREKVAPSVDDAAVRARAEQAVMQRAVARELNERVLWLERL